MTHLFISHALADKQLVDEFCDLLRTGCDLTTATIRCTSVDGAGIETGADFVEWIEVGLGLPRFR